jgi:hypothetical protein
MEPISSSEVFEEDPLLPIVEQDDGSVIIELSDEDEMTESLFGENLVTLMSKQERLQIAGDLIEMVDRDKESRKKRQEQYEMGIRRAGVGDDAPGGAQFSGASRVVHPMLAEACVDFEARAIKELMPSGGPVRTSITSEDDTERLELARLKRDILNIQLTKLIPEYRDELESLLSQLPMGGSQYMKIWFDGKRKRVEFIPIDHIFIPFSVTNFYSSPRVTQQQFISRQEFDARSRNGLYVIDDKLIDPNGTDLDRSPVDIANDKVEGKADNDAYNEDGLREVFEIYLDYDFTEWDELASDGVAPYIAHVDKFTSDLVGLYRNWREGDEHFNKLNWIVDWGFIPWRGAYKLGLPHLIGGLSAAATGALRALLDSAHQANAPTLLKLRAGRIIGQTSEVAVTQIHEIEGPSGIDDIRKLVAPLPFAGPNQILFQLLGALVDMGKGVVATAEEKIADVSDRMPVGTSLAMIEQGSKVFAAIHMRLHESQAKVLEILCRLNADYPDEEEWSRLMGKPVSGAIFENTDDISPVSDPNIFSEAQRYAQMQAVMQLMADPTINYNRIEGHRRMLNLLNVPEIDRLLPEPPRPKKAEPVQENMYAVSGVPLKAFPDQDHLAHVETHLRFILSPLLGAGPLYGGPQIAPLMGHIGEHMTMYYPQMVAQAQAMAVAQGALLPDASPERSVAVGMSGLDQILTPQLAPIMQMIQQAQQLVQSKMPQPPMDPQVQATMQVAQMEDARAKMEMQAKQQLEQAKLQMEGQKMQAEHQRQQIELQTEAQQKLHQQKMDEVRTFAQNRTDELEQQYKRELGILQQQVEISKNEHEEQVRSMTELLKNENTNQTNMMIAKMKEELKLANEGTNRNNDAAVGQMKELLGQIHQQKMDTGLNAVIEGLRVTIDQMNAPKTIIYDNDGNPVGLKTAQ